MTKVEQRAIETATRKSYAKPVLVKGPLLGAVTALLVSGDDEV